jgi:hypothetical protein
MVGGEGGLLHIAADDDDDEVGLYRCKSIFSHLPLSKRDILSVSCLMAS